MWRALPYAALAGIAVSLALMVLVGLCRFPAAVPLLDTRGMFPRVRWPVPDLWVTGILWTAMIVGAVGLLAGLVAVRLALDRLAGADRARRARVHLLWTLNPLMLWALIGGAHVDGLAVAGLATVGPSVLRSGAAGLLLGAAAAVKAPYLVIAAAAPARAYGQTGLAGAGAGDLHRVGDHDAGLLPVVRGAGPAAARAGSGGAAGLGAARPHTGGDDRLPARARRPVRRLMAAHRAPSVRGARCAASSRARAGRRRRAQAEIWTGVPSGSIFASFVIIWLLMRMHPWLTEVPSSFGSSVPWMPMIGSWPLKSVSAVDCPDSPYAYGP
jgi:hypothetical protein